MLDEGDVKRWYENVSRGSQITGDVYLRRLGSFCQEAKIDPKRLASLSELEMHNLMLDLVSSIEKAGFAGSYIEGRVKAIKSWLAHNCKEAHRNEIKGTKDAPSLKEERVPTRPELKLICLSSDKKQG